jgi:hypothetical protein
LHSDDDSDPLEKEFILDVGVLFVEDIGDMSSPPYISNLLSLFFVFEFSDNKIIFKGKYSSSERTTFTQIINHFYVHSSDEISIYSFDNHILNANDGKLVFN